MSMAWCYGWYLWQIHVSIITWANVVAQWAHDAIITSLWRQNDVATSFWRHNDVVIACVVCPLGVNVLSALGHLQFHGWLDYRNLIVAFIGEFTVTLSFTDHIVFSSDAQWQKSKQRVAIIMSRVIWWKSACSTKDLGIKCPVLYELNPKLFTKLHALLGCAF